MAEDKEAATPRRTLPERPSRAFATSELEQKEILRRIQDQNKASQRKATKMASAKPKATGARRGRPSKKLKTETDTQDGDDENTDGEEGEEGGEDTDDDGGDGDDKQSESAGTTAPSTPSGGDTTINSTSTSEKRKRGRPRKHPVPPPKPSDGRRKNRPRNPQKVLRALFVQMSSRKELTAFMKLANELSTKRLDELPNVDEPEKEEEAPTKPAKAAKKEKKSAAANGVADAKADAGDAKSTA